MDNAVASTPERRVYPKKKIEVRGETQRGEAASTMVNVLKLPFICSNRGKRGVLTRRENGLGLPFDADTDRSGW